MDDNGHRSRNQVTPDDDDLPKAGNWTEEAMEKGEWGVQNNAKWLRAGFGAPLRTHDPHVVQIFGMRLKPATESKLLSHDAPGIDST
ncbi:hypothetical protein ACLKA7_014999 [Drosophila subpalustris]